MSLQLYYPEDDSFFEFLANKEMTVVAIWYRDILLKKRLKNAHLFDHATQIFQEAKTRGALSDIVNEYGIGQEESLVYKKCLAA